MVTAPSGRRRPPASENVGTRNPSATSPDAGEGTAPALMERIERVRTAIGSSLLRKVMGGSCFLPRRTGVL